MSYIEKEKLIKADIASIENRVRHAFIDKLTENIPTWKLVLIDKWTDFKVWFWFKTHKGV